MTATAKSDTTLVAIMCDLARHYGKAYTFQSQDKLLELYRRRTGRTMCRRTLCRHLSGLEAQGFFKRVQRHQRHPERGFTFRSTLYLLQGAAFRAWGRIARTARNVARWSRVTVSSQYSPSGRELPAAPALPGAGPAGKETARTALAAAKQLLAGKHRP